ncbi:MAG: xanthine dehydrogenase family protein subunit M [Bacillota bacterium]
MRINEYYRPASVPDALKILQSGANTKILAGGTDLVIAIRERHVTPDALLDLSGIDELKRIYADSDGLHIGSMATFSRIETDPNVLKYCPMLCNAASQVGSPQIRNRATIGGNVANAATAADSLPSLLAMDAEALVASGAEKRYVKVDELLVGINKTILKPDELILGFRLQYRPDAYMDFEKIGRRKALAISRINLGVVLEFDGDAVKHAAVAVGAVGKRAYRVAEVEGFLAGKPLTEERNAEAVTLIDEVVARNLAGRSTTPYKRKIAAAVLARALEKALRGAAR